MLRPIRLTPVVSNDPNDLNLFVLEVQASLNAIIAYLNDREKEERDLYASDSSE